MFLLSSLCFRKSASHGQDVRSNSDGAANNGVCIYLDKISYAFYVMQFIAISYFGLKYHGMEEWPQSRMTVVLFVINFVCVVAL